MKKIHILFAVQRKIAFGKDMVSKDKVGTWIISVICAYGDAFLKIIVKDASADWVQL